jgi:hypothetical protein
MSGIVRIKNSNKETDPSLETIKFKNIDIVPLETTDDCLIQSIGKVVIKDSLIFFSDLYNLFVFNRKGKFLNKIGNKGQGPEEYISLYSYYIDEINNCVIIVDEFRNVFLSYEFNGKFISKKNFPANTIVCSEYITQLSDSQLFISYSVNPMHDDAYQLLNMKNMKILAKKKSRITTIDDLKYHFSWHPISKAEKGVDFIMPLCDTVFNCYNNEFQPKYIIEHSRKTAPVKNHQISSQKRIYLEDIKLELDKFGYFTGFKELFETENHILMNYTLRGYEQNCFIVNKKLNQGKYYSYSTSIELKEFPLFVINGTDGDNFISAMPADYALSLKEDIKETQDPDLKKLKSLLDNLLEDDNPILIFYELKDDFVP